ncbi:hypothetical protein [Chelativorans salis]|uniref:Uncharacterized protein n=1 Tax=Chelativorans salis TaxID=2978478 RepID=A0ABT2LS47_9HYPH|nr:hypothetical protein [Chelativorans sp. EGI FJ00035]MCT7377362.1 hypothetical protein [Chelativorans sp. EGI FJ00035]
MKRILPATILAASVLTTPVLAQGVSGDLTGGVSVGAEHGEVGVGVGAGAEVSGNASGGMDSSGVAATAGAAGNADADFEHAVASIRSSHDAVAEIAAVTDAPVNVVSINAIAEGKNKVALENVINDHAQAAAELRKSIEANAALLAALQSKGVGVASVVAASANADGSVTVYTE